LPNNFPAKTQLPFSVSPSINPASISVGIDFEHEKSEIQPEPFIESSFGINELNLINPSKVER